MSADTLSDLLRAVRLRGAFFFYVQGADPWVVETSQASEIIPVIMPGVEHMMEFHGIARGSCWAAIVGQEPIKLDQGDVILFPQGDAHVMSSAPGMRARVMDAGVHVMPKPPQLPYSLNVSEGATAAPRRWSPSRWWACWAPPHARRAAHRPRRTAAEAAGVGVALRC